MEKRKKILRKVKGYSDTDLNPSKRKLCDPAKDDVEEISSIKDILISLQISTTEYEAALSISDDNDFQVDLKKPPNFHFVNNYCSEGILAREANLDKQSVFNYYKVLAYMCAYISKSEDECKQATSERYI